jgi:hypothetical protein
MISKPYFSVKIQTYSEYDYRMNSFLLSKNFNTVAEFNTCTELFLKNNQKRIGCLKALLIPVRTDRFGNLCKDFFLPTVSAYLTATKVQSLFCRILISLILAPVDIISFPFRVITIIPRFIYNMAHPKESNAIYKYLISEGIDAQRLKEGYVFAEISWIESGKSLEDSEKFKGAGGELWAKAEIYTNIYREILSFHQVPKWISEISDQPFERIYFPMACRAE